MQFYVCPYAGQGDDGDDGLEVDPESLQAGMDVLNDTPDDDQCHMAVTTYQEDHALILQGLIEDSGCIYISMVSPEANEIGFIITGTAAQLKNLSWMMQQC